MTAQRIFGLTVDGVVGPVTWERLMREAANCESGGTSGGGGGVTQPTTPSYPGSPLRFGDQGEAVRQIQQATNRIAPRHPGRLWIIPESGIFGEQTRDAIFAFQSIFGLGVDGVVGPNTWNRLMQEAARTTTQSINAANLFNSANNNQTRQSNWNPLVGLLMSNMRRGRF